MNEYQIEGNWNEIKGKAKEKWGELTNDELDRIDGKSDQLIGAIQKRYGRSKEDATQEVNEWQRELGH